jgi:large subunit ribosomal protein L15
MPLQRRLPKRGFRRLQKNAARREEYAIVNLGRLTGFGAGETVDPPRMVESKLVPKGLKVKILGGGELLAPLTVRAHAFSAAAREKIGAAGGSAEVV